MISLYANSDNKDAHGSLSNIIVGGLNENVEKDETGPEIKLYIDDERFEDGSMTNENPLLLAYIKDENGVNTSGAGIGHDITATLSGATNKVYTLNQFYEAPLSKDESGLLSYKFYGLNEGEHTLTFKVWDIHNNSSTATIRFDVVKGKVINMENITNYPNPMNGSTNFTFEHNQNYYSLTRNIIDLSNLSIIRAGVKLGEFKGKDFIYDFHYSRSLTNFKNEINITLEELIKYQKGEILTKKINKGFVLVKYNNIPVSFGKSDGEIIKNHYPKHLRF
jgi:NOL1/NOP2/fmu family ribosome biogenesis protein